MPHPCTILRIYRTYCLPILLYGAELWHITQTEQYMLERTHRKIARTILGMPVRCSSKALLHIIGTMDIKALIHQKQLQFLFSFSQLPSDSLPLKLLRTLIRSPPPTGLIRTLLKTHSELDLPPVNTILDGQWSKTAWKNLVKNILLVSQYSEFISQCTSLPLSKFTNMKLGKVIPHVSITRGLPKLTKMNSFRLRLLTNCHGLESDTCRFRPNQAQTCRLCGEGNEDIEHFVLSCPALSSARSMTQRMSMRLRGTSGPPAIVDRIVGASWIEDPQFHRDTIEFLDRLHRERLRLLALTNLPTQVATLL